MSVDLNLLTRLEQEYNLPNGLLEQVMMQESRGNMRAYNEKSGAAGPFQFIPATAKERGVDPYNFPSAATGAAKYLAEISQQYDGDWEKALAGYNWGPNRPALKTANWMEQAPEETRNYVRTITSKTPGLQTFEVELPDGTVIEGIPLGTTKAQILEKLKARGYDTTQLEAEMAKDAKPPEKDWQAMLSAAQTGRWRDVMGGMAGGVGGAVLGSPAGPVGTITGGVIGGAGGTMLGTLANIRKAQQEGALGYDVPEDEIVRYVLKEGAISAGLDVALLGAGKALTPLGKTLIQRMGVTEDAFAKGLNKYLKDKGADVFAGFGWRPERAAEWYRQTGVKIEHFLHQEIQDFSNSLKTMPGATGEQIQDMVKAARKTIGDKFSAGIRIADEGTALGRTPVTVTPGMRDLFKLVDDAVTKHGYAEAQEGALLTAKEAKQLKHIVTKSGWTVGELRTLKGNLQRMAEGSYDEAGKVAASPEFSDKIAKEAIRSIDQAIDENLKAAGKVAEASTYSAANKAYSEAISAFEGKAVRTLMTEDPTKLAQKVIADNSKRSVDEARGAVAELVKLGKLNKRAAGQFDDELRRSWIDKNAGDTKSAAEMWERLHPTSKGAAYSPADKRAFESIFPTKKSQKAMMDILEANRNLVEWKKTLPEQEALGAGRVGTLAILGSATGAAAGGPAGAAAGAASAQAGVFGWYTWLPKALAMAASSGDIRALNQASFLSHYFKNYTSNLAKAGPFALGATSGMAAKAAQELEAWYREKEMERERLGKVDMNEGAQ